jgi:hypothetical protein
VEKCGATICADFKIADHHIADCQIVNHQIADCQITDHQIADHQIVDIMNCPTLHFPNFTKLMMDITVPLRVAPNPSEGKMNLTF